MGNYISRGEKAQNIFICIYLILDMAVSNKAMPLLIGEGSEEIGNMIHNYIKEIEELRYKVTKCFILNFLVLLVHQQPFQTTGTHSATID